MKRETSSSSHGSSVGEARQQTDGCASGFRPPSRARRGRERCSAAELAGRRSGDAALTSGSIQYNPSPGLVAVGTKTVPGHPRSLEDRRGGGRDGFECVVEGDRDESLARRRLDDRAECLASVPRLLELRHDGLEPGGGHAEPRIGPAVVDGVEAEQQLRRPSEQVGNGHRNRSSPKRRVAGGCAPPSRCRAAATFALRAHEHPGALFPGDATLRRPRLPQTRGASNPHQARPVSATTSSTPSTSAAAHAAENPANLRLHPRLTRIGPPLRRGGSHVDRSIAPSASVRRRSTASSRPEDPSTTVIGSPGAEERLRAAGAPVSGGGTPPGGAMPVRREARRLVRGRCPGVGRLPA